VITLLYGQPGTGKSTLATGMILDALRDGRRVVSNFAVDPAPACLRPNSKLSNSFVEVIPARPSFLQLSAIGHGWLNPKDHGREDRSGLLVLDEVGGWINSRNWAEKDRQLIIDWFLHSRKRGWDIIFIAQHPNLIDKQVREAVVEGYARIRRTDRMSIPMTQIKLPRMHIAIARYGLDQNAPRLNTWAYRGTTEHKCFASYALFDSSDDLICGTYCTLPPRLTRWKGAKTSKEFKKLKTKRVLISKPRPPLISALMKIQDHQTRLLAFHLLQNAGTL
jgi:hypothetical protein